MRSDLIVARGLAEASARFAASAVTIGNFDGVHIGHQTLMARLGGHGAVPTAVTFDPHPTSVVAPDRAPRLMTQLHQRIEWMAEAGIRQVLVIPFDREFSRVSPVDFVQQVLVDAVRARHVAVGTNFRFGHKQGGTVELLREMGVTLGFTVEGVGAVTFRGKLVSSTEIRKCVETGRLALAMRMLGRPFGIEGDVVPGHGVGSAQTVSTLNLATSAQVLPARGVYVTQVRDLDTDRRWAAVTNIGFRPTFGGDTLAIESHVIEAYQGKPPARIGLDFFHRIRDERKFPDAAALKVQILRDVGRAHAWWRRARKYRAGRL
ncbi:MAG: bifunctional riboflavin kinase/FAD synthetase [Acidobacteria bacterium]|nr:bifunctional riboflavin kinase/FAD synthetase [Acidobacteriota bacterium]